MTELIQQLVSQLGVQPDQARGGAGLLFKLAQDRLGGDFGTLSAALPGMGELLKAAPAGGGGALGALGGLASSFGGGKAAGLASLALGFAQLKLDPAMVGKFLPIVLEFVKGKAGGDVASMLAGVLK
ncbi:MAG: DUF2780 domain-containing protein [Candidatus Delongbacteria bacterium]|nr:DUF2780 domain-containing protein [Candidatus Delongbacteria bacterium]